MKKEKEKMYCCHDELISNLYNMSFLDIEMDDNGKVLNNAKRYGKGVSIEILSDTPIYVEYGSDNQLTLFDIESKEQRLYDNRYSLSPHEIILFNILLSKCIENQSEVATISLSEIHYKYRGKRIGNKEVMDETCLAAYLTALEDLANKEIKYDIGNNRKRFKILNTIYTQPLLVPIDRKVFDNKDFELTYSLGEFGKLLISSKRYSKIMPDKASKIPFNQISYMLVAMYISRIIFINKRMKKDNITIKLSSIMKAINKYDNKGVNLGITLYDYSGSNLTRTWERVYNYVVDILKCIKNENNISNYSTNDGSVLDNDEFAADTKDYINCSWNIRL